MHNEKGQKKGELFELSFLSKKLGNINVYEDECPDFLYTCDDVKVGIEHVRCFPTKVLNHESIAIQKNNWHSEENKICSKLEEDIKEKITILYDIYKIQYDTKFIEELTEEFRRGISEFMKSSSYKENFCIYSCNISEMKHISCMSCFRNSLREQKDKEHNILFSKFIGGQEIAVAKIDSILKEIRKKENKLVEYKKLEKNKDIEDYWLSIYIPEEEYCVLTETAIQQLSNSLKDSEYNRIYLINGRFMYELQNGNYQSIKQLK